MDFEDFELHMQALSWTMARRLAQLAWCVCVTLVCTCIMQGMVVLHRSWEDLLLMAFGQIEVWK